jgi:cytoskeletal protein RodZ
MATVSEQLRHAREEQHLSVYQVAETTKIKTDHVRALEAGNFEIFSAPVYIRGFIRTYATMLKLDVRRLLTDLEAELGQSERFREPPPLTNTPRSPLDFVMLQLSKLSWRLTVGVSAAALFLVVAITVIYRQANREDAGTLDLQKLGAGLYHAGTNQEGETLPLP